MWQTYPNNAKRKEQSMTRVTRLVLILVLCGLAGSTISSCKKKGKETKSASAEYAANTSALRKRVKKQIKDKIRKQNVMILVDDVDRARAKLTVAWLDMQHRLQKNPTMSREEVEAEVKTFEGLRVAALQEMAKSRLAMRKYITAEEWKKLFPEPKKKKGDDKAAEPEDTKTEPESADNATDQPGESAPETKESAGDPEKPESEE
jgi:Spy/CpxP family protein refolding chaperone